MALLHVYTHERPRGPHWLFGEGLLNSPDVESVQQVLYVEMHIISLVFCSAVGLEEVRSKWNWVCVK